MSELPQSLLSVVKQFSERLMAALPDHLIGFYLIGSAAMDGYHEERSDIDFVAVVKSPPTADEISQLAALHKKLKASFPKKVVEGLYVPADRLGNSEKRALTYYNGILSYSFAGVNAVTWFTLKKHGVTISGMPADALPFIFPHRLLVEYVRENVNTYWVKWLHGARRLPSKRGLAAFTKESAQWGVLGISRMYYTLREHDVTSKEDAGRYVLDLIPAQHKPVVQDAIYLRLGKGTSLNPAARRKAMLCFMAYMIDQCGGVL